MADGSAPTTLPNPGPLTVEQRKLIKATVPILVEHGTTITRHFYGAMLDAHPELKNVFSHSKQAVRSADPILNPFPY